jgi:hypothetical protein
LITLFRHNVFRSLFFNKGQQGDMTRLFDGPGQGTLVLGTGTGLAARPDTAVFRHIAAQDFVLLIINGVYLLDTEGTNSTFAVIGTAQQIITLHIIVHNLLLKSSIAIIDAQLSNFVVNRPFFGSHSARCSPKLKATSNQTANFQWTVDSKQWIVFFCN